MNPKLLHRYHNRQDYSTRTWLPFLIRLSLVLSPFFLIDVTGLLSNSRIPSQSETSFRTSNARPSPHDHYGFYPDHQRRHRRQGHDKWTILLAATTDNQNDGDNNSNGDETDLEWNELTNVDDASTPSSPLSINETPPSIANINNNNNINYHVIKKNNPKSKRKPPSDNRDQLPFVVQLITPDPYTRPEVAKERARKNTVRDRQQQQQQQQLMRSNNNISSNSRRSGTATPRISASLFETTKSSSNDDAPTVTALGEFVLDQSTTCGDIVVVGEQSYLVQTAKCQYKYAGGKRFDMVRKILHVKPIRRVQVEAVLQRSLQQTSKYFEDAKDDDDSIMLE